MRAAAKVGNLALPMARQPRSQAVRLLLVLPGSDPQRVVPSVRSLSGSTSSTAPFAKIGDNLRAEFRLL